MSSRSTCRAIGCRGKTDVIVLQRVMGNKVPMEPDWVKIGLCKRHCRQWLNWLDDMERGEPVTYKRWMHTIEVVE